jgi:3-oxoacyl-[acyl-carrier protein] reductase
MVDVGIKKFGKIDILINNAGVGSSFLIEDMPPEVWDKTVGITLTGAFNCTKAVAPYMIKQKSGKIVFISSVGGHRTGGRGASDYITTKHGILGFMKAMAYELGIHGINVNAICPGPVLTDMLRSRATQEEIDAMKKEMPILDICIPEDIADAAMYLVSDAARCVTGHSLNVDSGATLAAGIAYTKIMEGKIALSKQLLEQYKKEKKS